MLQEERNSQVRLGSACFLPLRPNPCLPVLCCFSNQTPSAKFVKCDVSKWEDQVELFKTAATFTGKIDYVVANAGICPQDEIFSFAGT